MTFGVLLIVGARQFRSFGLLTELITSHNEERSGERERAGQIVDEVLR